MNHPPGREPLIPTRYTVMRPEQPHEGGTIEWPPEPTLAQLKALICPLLDGADPEHVSVLADFSGGDDYRPADMFVDEIGHHKGLPRNEAATLIYRRFWLMRHPEDPPESLPYIVGNAILFDRTIWS